MRRLLPLLLSLLLVGAGCAPSPSGGFTPDQATGSPAPTPASRAELASPTAVPSASAPLLRDFSRGAAPPNQEASLDLAVAIRDVAQRARPGVVFIGVKGTALGNALLPIPVEGVGSGAIYDPSGLIVTNNHVVENAEQISVTLPDGRSFDGQLVGRDPQTDLAVVRIQGDNLPVLPFGDSDQLQIGDWVVAIGNALGLEGGPTVTTGVVGALHRSIQEPNGATLQELIQTDAAINPGNSGGPLVNLRGEIVGINTAAAVTDQGVPAAGVGFAISINSAKPILAQLASTGHVRRAFLGVVPVTITPALAAQYHLPVKQGVILAQVDPNSPAAQAGMRPNDILLSLDNTPLKSVADLRNVLAAHNPGDTVSAVILRNGSQRQLSVTLGEAPAP